MSFRTVGILLLILMFLLSGIEKLRNTRGCPDAQQVMTALSAFGVGGGGRLKCTLAVAILLIGAVWEIASSCAVVWGLWSGHKTAERSGLLSLALFTVLATLMFKLIPKFKYHAFMANVSVFGGLLAAAAAV